MRTRLLAVVSGLLVLTAGALARPARAADARGDWLLGAWEWGAHSRFEFTRAGDTIAWTMKRGRFESQNPRWGEKAAVEVSGTVTRISENSVELVGRYDWSDDRHLVGRTFRFWLKREGDVLRGEAVGAGNEVMPAVLRRVR
ncbi:MAG: hypothetical protein HY613_07625 [Candidatus Rokubacteria bacterium]|nr:hypothetical protein [Candidatus Rokubacteria bacterium]